jgi:hypothetical protein
MSEGENDDSEHWRINSSHGFGLIHVGTHCSIRVIVIYNVHCECCAINRHLVAFTVTGNISEIS